MSKVIVTGGDSDKVYMALHEAGIFEDTPAAVRRVVIDLEVGHAAKVYVERFLDDRFIDVVLGGKLELVTGKREEPPAELDDPARQAPSFRGGAAR